MFNYRHRQLADDLAAQARARAIYPDPLNVVRVSLVTHLVADT
jgi:hypothetical protein